MSAMQAEATNYTIKTTPTAVGQPNPQGFVTITHTNGPPLSTQRPEIADNWRSLVGVECEAKITHRQKEGSNGNVYDNYYAGAIRPLQPQIQQGLPWEQAQQAQQAAQTTAPTAPALLETQRPKHPDDVAQIARNKGAELAVATLQYLPKDQQSPLEQVALAEMWKDYILSGRWPQTSPEFTMPSVGPEPPGAPSPDDDIPF